MSGEVGGGNCGEKNEVYIQEILFHDPTKLLKPENYGYGWRGEEVLCKLKEIQ
jgi:hypothetical protein